MTTPNRQHDKEATAYVALGSNLGGREQYLRAAIAALRQLGAVQAVSSFYETAPVGPVRQPDFLNAVVELRTGLPPQELMTRLLGIEREQGRDRGASLPKGPRTLDLDLLSYDELVMETSSLTLPHPALTERRFVLVPLEEIAPAWRHPASRMTATELLADLYRQTQDKGQNIRRIEPPASPNERANEW